MKPAAAIVSLALLTAAPAAFADTGQAIDRLLAASRNPGGVVFEMMTFEDHAWRWAAPLLRRAVDRLRARHPSIDIALVSHGSELFELALPTARLEMADLRRLEQLHADGVRLHIDGGYARWKRLDRDDFPTFVDLVPSAAATLDDYGALGFVVIPLEPPRAPD